MIEPFAQGGALLGLVESNDGEEARIVLSDGTRLVFKRRQRAGVTAEQFKADFPEGEVPGRFEKVADMN